MKAKIGLEIHAYLNMERSKTKLFCSCAVAYQDAEPNMNVCPICTSMPGSKPMLPNKEAVDKCIAIALMLGCKVSKNIHFQRKHYSWPDLPSGYQKTVSGPRSDFVGKDGKFNGVGLWELHLEEDPAKWDPSSGRIDYNRSGVPLVEIVTAPELTSSEQVKTWLRSLVVLLNYINAVPRNVAIKADVNVSTPGHPRVEVKNVNSFRNIVRAIEHEISRQTTLTKKGKKAKQETRGFNEETGTTYHMRFKESAEDYRFIIEPDLPTMIVDKKYVDRIKQALPESPEHKIEKFKKKFKLSAEQARVLSSELVLATLFEDMVHEVSPQLAVNWLTVDMLKLLKEQDVGTFSIDSAEVAKILKLLEQKEITEKTVKDMLRKLLWENMSIEAYRKKFKVEKISDEQQLEKLCVASIKHNAKAVQDYKKGKQDAFNSLIGYVMKETKGRANHQVVTRMLKKLLK